MWLGVFYGILGCALWGFIYLVPLLLPTYDPVSLAMARFVFFGLGSLCFVPYFRKQLSQLSLRDWFWAFCLSFFGNAVYYAFLTQGIRMAGVPTSGMLMTLIPINVALIANRPGNGIVLPWKKLLAALTLIFIGLWIGNIEEFLTVKAQFSAADYWIGFLCSFIAMALWTWFPLKNGQWLIRHPQVAPLAWTTAQGVSILPVTVLGYVLLNWNKVGTDQSFWGADPQGFLVLLLIAGVVCGWGGMALWNLMSARLPVALSGQMIVFETIFSVIYALIYRKQAPDWTLVVGLVVLLSGVILSLKFFREAIDSQRPKA